jgi:hypothetical protein
MNDSRPLWAREWHATCFAHLSCGVPRVHRECRRTRTATVPLRGGDLHMAAKKKAAKKKGTKKKAAKKKK